MLSRIVRVVLIVFAFLVLVPSALRAQSQIAGVVKDTSGAVLPGVTVTASSPALIEKSRSVTTDGAGNYLIVSLAPGKYSVTFTLQGFSTVRRENLDLPANFTLSVNAEMPVGAVENAITVTGEAPVMDVKQAAVQQVLEKAVLDAVPLGGRDIQSIGVATAGVSQSGTDVGGTGGMQQNYLSAHGADPRDNTIMINDVKLNGIEGDGAIQQYFNAGAMSEMGYQTSNIGAERSGGGVVLDMISKDGSNQFHGDVFYSQTSHALQAASAPFTGNFVTGLNKPTSGGNFVSGMHDVNADIGGPILKDKLWFFFAYRHWGVNQTIANSFGAGAYSPNTITVNTTPVLDSDLIRSYFPRFTWNVTKNNKFSVYYDKIVKFRGAEQSNPPTGTSSQYTLDTFGQRIPDLYYTTVWNWTSVLSSHMILDLGFGINNESYSTAQLQPYLEACLAAPTATCGPKTIIPSFDIGNSSGYASAGWGAPFGPYYFRTPVRETGQGALSYVTGTHAFKVGFEDSRGYNTIQESFQNSNVNFFQEFQAGHPLNVVIYNTPLQLEDHLRADLGIFVEDKWTIKHRLTVSPGLRWEYYSTYYNHNNVPPSSRNLMTLEGYNTGNPNGANYVPSSFPDANMPIWRTWSPRLGVAYDVFGNGKTAIKGGINKYEVAFSTSTIPQSYDPMVPATDTRAWTDSNGNNIYDPGVDVLGPSPAPLGTLFRTLDPHVKRPYELEYNVLVQQQVHAGISVSVGFFHRSYANLLASYNTALQASMGAPIVGFTPISYANPCASGTIVCGGVAPANLTLWKIDPALIGKGEIIDTNSTSNTRVYNGIEESFSGRIGKAQFFGGVTTQRQISNTCQASTLSGGFTAATGGFQAASDPNFFSSDFCDQTKYGMPFQTLFKISGTYGLPLGFTLSGSFQSYPGGNNNIGSVSALNWQSVKVSSSTVKPLLTSGQATEAYVQLVQSGTLYVPRLNQMDFRVTKLFKLGEKWGTLQPQMDIFNLFNANTPVAAGTTYGSSLNFPTAYLPSRLIQFGVQYHF